MSRMKKLAFVIGVAVLGTLALPQRGRAFGCIQSPCVNHSYEICCPPPSICKSFGC
jgi:hypothetical protein